MWDNWFYMCKTVLSLSFKGNRDKNEEKMKVISWFATSLAINHFNAVDLTKQVFILFIFIYFCTCLYSFFCSLVEFIIKDAKLSKIMHKPGISLTDYWYRFHSRNLLSFVLNHCHGCVITRHHRVAANDYNYLI